MASKEFKKAEFREINLEMLPSIIFFLHLLHIIKNI